MTLLFIHGGKVVDTKPIAHFLMRLESAVKYYEAHPDDDIAFLISGRWTSVTEDFEISEAEAGKRWLQERIPDARVYKEDISVELIGNYAFSKPLIKSLQPDRVIVFVSELLQPRTEALLKRIYAQDIPYEVIIHTTDQSDNLPLVERERLALELFTNLFAEVADGDDAAFRDKLLYGTPYYFKGIIDDRAFFEQYWSGGFDHYLGARHFRATLG